MSRPLVVISRCVSHSLQSQALHHIPTQLPHTNVHVCQQLYHLVFPLLYTIFQFCGVTIFLVSLLAVAKVVYMEADTAGNHY